MTSSPSADEQPKRTVAKRVIAAKRRYFVPEHGVSVEADSAEEASATAKAQAEKNVIIEEEGDV